ncbi:uncharacterized protein LOC131957886 [Physella acuta]|uniref:uncharacterized protein LOC131957886 n=1 Tax=Physella acuta TaxID=109671 RepID=UPI0027DBBE12|nr:uncharacterized protein LOC131957886 [Physella acuta]
MQNFRESHGDTREISVRNRQEMKHLLLIAALLSVVASQVMGEGTLDNPSSSSPEPLLTTAICGMQGQSCVNYPCCWKFICKYDKKARVKLCDKKKNENEDFE